MIPTKVVSTTATCTRLASRAATSTTSDMLDPFAGKINMESGASLTATPPIIRLITAKVPADHKHRTVYQTLCLEFFIYPF